MSFENNLFSWNLVVLYSETCSYNKTLVLQGHFEVLAPVISYCMREQIFITYVFQYTLFHYCVHLVIKILVSNINFELLRKIKPNLYSTKIFDYQLYSFPFIFRINFCVPKCFPAINTLITYVFLTFPILLLFSFVIKKLVSVINLEL